MGNVVLNKNATASGYVAPFTPAKAVDGSQVPLSRWICDAMPCWMSVDLGELFWIDRWVVRHMATATPVPTPGWPAPSYCMSTYKLQGSADNANWVDLDTVNNNTQATTDRNLSPKQARWVRVYVTNGNNNNKGLAAIQALEVYESAYDPYLSGLSISVGSLSPAFNKKVFAYTGQVDNSVPSITVTPTAEAANSSISVNGQTVVSGHASQAIGLNVGDTTITIAVTNGQITQSYIITVTRQSAATYLSNLVLNGPRGVITINPSFEKTTFNYTANTPGVNSVTVTPTAEKSDSIIEVNGQIVSSGQPSQSIILNAGSNTITIEVFPLGGSPTKYTLIVTK